jgi:hypothetical protein
MEENYLKYTMESPSHTGNLMYQQKCPIQRNSKAVRDMVLLLMWYSTTATDDAAMLSNDGRGRTWRMECLPRWMAENNLCGGRQTESFYLARQKTTDRLAGSCPRHLGQN